MSVKGKGRLATNIDEELLQEFKIQAVKEKKKINELLEEIIISYLNDKEEK